MAKIGYADDAVSAIAAAVGQATQSITGVLGLRQQRLTQESISKTQEKGFDTQVQLSEEELFKQIAKQNADFSQNVLSLERQKRNMWQTSTGVLTIIAIVAVVILSVYLIVKK